MDINSSKHKSLKNIAIFHHQYSYGGVDTHLLALINNWPNKNDNFFIISNNDNSGIKNIINNQTYKNIEFFFIDELDQNQNDFFFNFKKVYFKLDKYLKHKSINTFIINNGGFPGSLYALLLSILNFNQKLNIKKFLLIHHAPIFKGKIIIKFLSLLISLLIRIKRIEVITVSNASKKLLISNTFIKNISVINNGLELKKFQNFDLLSLDIFKNINFKKKIILGMIGPLDDHKGHYFVLDLLKDIDKEKFIFIIVGKGKNYSQLKETIKNYDLKKNIILTGYLEEHQYSIIENFDILLFPTRDFEGFGYSMAEAMYLKKTVIASNVGAIPEFVINLKNGILLDPFDKIGWQKSIANCIEDSGLRYNLGTEAFKTIKNQFDAKRMAYEYFKKIS
mgnify:CR=1 FL=1|tara:strand:- start:360 stop:1538 length:1179 start_codon:yes stop_codon:yes gene_type:complete